MPLGSCQTKKWHIQIHVLENPPDGSVERKGQSEAMVTIQMRGSGDSRDQNWMCGLVRKWMWQALWGPGVSELEGGGEEGRVLDDSRGQSFLGGQRCPLIEKAGRKQALSAR